MEIATTPDVPIAFFVKAVVKSYSDSLDTRSHGKNVLPVTGEKTMSVELKQTVKELKEKLEQMKEYL